MSRKSKNSKKPEPSPQPASPSVHELMEKHSYEEAAKLLQEQLAAQPSDDKRRLLAECLENAPDYPGALKVLATLQQRQPVDDLHQGWLLLNCEDIDKAQEILRRYVSLRPEHASGHYWLARAYSHWKCRDESSSEAAIGSLRRAVSCKGCQCEAYTLLASLLPWSKEGCREKVLILEEALAKFPDSEDARLDLSKVYIHHLNLEQKGLDVLKPLLECEHPNTKPLWQAYEASKRLGLYADARRFLTAIPAEHFEHPIKEYLLGDLDLLSSDFDSAVRTFTNGLGEAGHRYQVQLHFGRADALLSLGCVDQAIEDARTAALALLTSTDDALTYGSPVYFHLQDDLQELLVTRSLIRVCKFLLDNDSEAIRNTLGDDLRGAAAYALFKATEETPDLSFELLLTAAEYLDHPTMWPDLEGYYYHVRDFARGLQYHLRWSRREYRYAAGDADAVSAISGIQARIHLSHDELPTTKKQCRSVVRAFAEELDTGPDKNEVDAVFVPTYVSFVRACLREKEMYSDLLEPAERLVKRGSNDLDVLWDYAYAHHCLGHKQEAEAAYRRLLEIQGDNASALHNLSLLVHDSGRIEEALSLSEKAASLSGDDKNIAGWHGKLQARKADQDRKAQQQEDFLRTAVQRWPKLDRYKRQLVCTLSLISGWQNFGHLSRLSGIEEKYLRGHLRVLEEEGMIFYPKDGIFQVNPHILALVERENTHAVVTKLIHGDESIAFKPIFNSWQEYTIYHILIGLFPNHLVFPNMALQTVFQYERMQCLLDNDTFGFFLRTQVRFCVTSTANYLPLIAFELDNDFHDSDNQKQRDAKKDRIFEVGGVPLLRLRGYGKPTEAAIRNQIIQDIQSLGDTIRQMPKKSAVISSLERELDFEKFGVQHDAGSSQRWLTVTDAASISGANAGVISRAVDTGELLGNGLKDRDRRVDAVSLTQWMLQRAGKSEPEESVAEVERLVKKHVKD